MLPVYFPPRAPQNFPPNCCLVEKSEMAEGQESSEKMTAKHKKRDANLLAFTGAAALLALTAGFAISAFNSHRRRSKKKGPGLYLHFYFHFFTLFFGSFLLAKHFQECISFVIVVNIFLCATQV